MYKKKSGVSTADIFINRLQNAKLNIAFCELIFLRCLILKLLSQENMYREIAK